jgi:acyl-CoA thioester hydrolase
MINNKTEVRVRYADTDQMHFVYNGKYLEYFEIGRTEMLREIGLAYSVIEKQGYQLPVLEANVKFISPAFYDDILIIESFMNVYPLFKIHIDYRINRKENNALVAEGYTEHVFIKEDSKKPIRPPLFFVEIVQPFYPKN